MKKFLDWIASGSLLEEIVRKLNVLLEQSHEDLGSLPESELGVRYNKDKNKFLIDVLVYSVDLMTRNQIPSGPILGFLSANPRLATVYAIEALKRGKSHQIPQIIIRRISHEPELSVQLALSYQEVGEEVPALIMNTVSRDNFYLNYFKEKAGIGEEYGRKKVLPSSKAPIRPRGTVVSGA